jgi:hypothetical protein
MSKRVTGLVAALAAVALGLAFVSSGQAQTPDATISVSSATIVPSGATTCPFQSPDTVEATCIVLSVTPAAGVSVGTVTFEVAYDVALLDVTNPFPDPTGDPGTINPIQGTGACNGGVIGTADSPVTCAIVNTTPLNGTIAVLEFTSIAGVGVSPLTITITGCTTGGASPTDLNCAASNGTITIQVATPTPTPSPSPSPTLAPTASPTATPAALPQTGGSESDGSGTGVAWLLGALGLAVVAGGVWAVSRTRRHTA